MNTYTTRRALLAVALTFSTGAAIAAGNASVAKDLTNTLSLLGLPCGRVVHVVKRGEKDYIATCQDKNRYRVYVNAKGRVVAQKR